MSIIITDNNNGQKAKYTYRDININRFELLSSDLHVDDYDAIRNSIFNIFTVRKGSRSRTPDFGSNLVGWLFEPITTRNAKFLGEEVEEELKQEPRIVVQDVLIEVDEPNGVYYITVSFYVPSLTTDLITMGLNGTSVGFQPSHFKVNP